MFFQHKTLSFVFEGSETMIRRMTRETPNQNQQEKDTHDIIYPIIGVTHGNNRLFGPPMRSEGWSWIR